MVGAQARVGVWRILELEGTAHRSGGLDLGGRSRGWVQGFCFAPGHMVLY